MSTDINKRSFASGGAVEGAIANRPYIIDPATGNVIPNPNLQRLQPKTFASMIGSGGSGEIGYTPNPDFVTPEQQRAYYAQNPMMANVTGIAQGLIGMTPIGALQSYIDPEGVAAREAMFQRETPAPVIDMSSYRTTAPVVEMSPEMRAMPVVDMSTVREPAPIEAGPTSEGYGLAPGTVSGGLQNPQQRAEMAAEAAASQQTSEQNDADKNAAGGLLGLAKGGMRSGGFVVPADVVSMVGEGNTDAGYKRIKAMVPTATAIKGKDGGQSDTVKTNIEGKQRARVAHGEMYIPPEAVKRLGGAKKLYAMMDRVRAQATGSKKQIKPVNLKRAMA